MSLSAFTLFCEDVRAEKAGTESIVGIFPDNISADKGHPFAFPKLAIYTRIRISLDWKIEPITVLLAANSSESMLTSMDEEFLSKTLGDARSAGAPFATITSRAVFAPFPVPEPTRFIVVVTTASERIEAGYMNVAPAPEGAIFANA